MARLTPETYKPVLAFRFKVQFEGLQNVQFYGKSVTLPAAQNNPIVVDYANTYIKVKGKTRWDDITMTCHAFEGMTQEELWAWLDKKHHKVQDGKDTFPDEYKSDVKINLMNPGDDKIIATWTLVDAFISSINWGNLDWSTEEVLQPEVTIAYDYALFESFSSEYQFT